MSRPFSRGESSAIAAELRTEALKLPARGEFKATRGVMLKAADYLDPVERRPRQVEGSLSRLDTANVPIDEPDNIA